MSEREDRKNIRCKKCRIGITEYHANTLCTECNEAKEGISERVSKEEIRSVWAGL